MARGKKEAKVLTPEEKLEQALVPVDEQPYLIPENWCWVYMDTICGGFQYGYTEKASFEPIGPHFIRITDIGNGIINDATAPYCRISDDEYPNYKIKKNDIFIARMGSVGENGLATHDIDGVFASYLIRLIPYVPAKYVCEYLQSNLYWGQITNKSQGTTRLNVNANILKKLVFPLPPLAEQQRIVDRIESLFAKLDEAKEKAQAIVDGFELRKSAILHKAFTGELTEQWREMHDVGLDSWQHLSIDSICNSLKYGTAKKSEKSGAVVVIRMGNLQQGEIDWSDLAFSNDQEDINKYHLEVGDVLFNRTNSAALVGKTSIYRGEYPAIYAGYLIKLDYDHDMITGDFLNYALNTNDAKEYCNSVKTDGVNQSNINAKKIGAYIIPVPPIDEQEEVVAILQKLLAKEKQAKEAAEAVLDQIDTMKKAILARAFRGELGTNDPAEESAVELLKSVLDK